MRIFLIDFENVHSEGMIGVDNLTEEDEVAIFYSVNADSVSFEILHKLMFCKAKLSYFKIRRGGRNALDFQLATYLGYLISVRPDAQFFLISRDNGFDFAVDFWETGYVEVKPSIRRFVNVKDVLAYFAGKAKKAASSKVAEASEVGAANEVGEAGKVAETSEVGEASEAAPASVSDSDEAEVDRLLSDSKSSHELYISTVKRFGQKKGVEIYRSIKSRFFTKKTG
ncbi:MAG: hypothetical protein LBI36_03695 [Oscillospiraceae bacterium]|jgi:hypothetical protein|nr:hypothetical protein [Oscillospiraceae bacterium]